MFILRLAVGKPGDCHGKKAGATIVFLNQGFKDTLESKNVSVVGGIQLNPHGRIFLDLRYVLGTRDIWKGRVGVYYNQAVQATPG